MNKLRITATLRLMPALPVSAILLISVLSLMDCRTPYTPAKKPPVENPPVICIDDLFVPEETADDQIRTVFSTNNTQYIRPEGMTIWTVWDTETQVFGSRTVLMGKSNGYSGGGYGIVFCQGEYEIAGEMQPAMLVVMVNNEGNYIIGKCVGGVFSDFGWWKATPYLQRGAGAGNEVTISYEPDSDDFCLDINGNFIERFRDDNDPVLRGGKNGYIAVLTPFDQFPQTAVTVYFTER